MKIPSDCDALLMLGPSLPFSFKEVEAIKSYVEEGGSLLLMVDPPLRAGLKTGLESLVRKWGVTLENDLLFDVKNKVGGNAGNIVAYGNNKSVITAGAREVRAFIHKGRSLDIKDIGGKWKAEYFLRSANTSTSVSMDKRKERQGISVGKNSNGSFACAVSAFNDKGARVVVIGDSDMASNIGLKKYHNRPILLSSVYWIVSRNEHRIEIPEREDTNRSISFNAYISRTFFWVAIVGLPQLVLLLGLSVWYFRRQ
jgi:ABC-type uncharacterized transport system involved in gliding motility auxiliary subunit